jgi:hypothetical protein
MALIGAVKDVSGTSGMCPERQGSVRNASSGMSPVEATRLVARDRIRHEPGVSLKTVYATDMGRRAQSVTAGLVHVHTRLVNAIYTGARRPVLGAYTA